MARQGLALQYDPRIDEAIIIRIHESITQLVRYALVGVLSNVAGYLVYLAFTYLGGTPKATMTLLYGVGATIGFFGNRSLAFKHQGSIMGAGVRYAMAHCVGYLLNLGILMVFVDRLGFAHQWVQAVAIVVVAAFLFVAFKLFVFPAKREEAR